MRVFDFILLSGYELSGVDVAQGFRAGVFEKNNIDARFIFTDVPTLRDIRLYEGKKIKRSHMMSAHLFLTGHADMKNSVRKENLLEYIKTQCDYDTMNESNNVIQICKEQRKVIEIQYDGEGNVICEKYYKDDNIFLINYYTDSLAYTELYAWSRDDNGVSSNIERRIFWDSNGRNVFEQMFIGDKIKYVFNNGKTMDTDEFVDYFVKSLKLGEEDICIMDRAGYFNFQRSLFRYKNGAKLIGVLHSDHYFEMHEDEGSLYMNYEYYYWFKYSHKIDCLVVGTEEHKQKLKEKLIEYGCYVPQIAVIPPGALKETRQMHDYNRNKWSIISASRLNSRKGVDILIRGMIKAHKVNPYIYLDIYGSGSDIYVSYLNNIVTEADAESYIHFKGHCNMEGVYRNYEVFASFSLWETFGLSLMEAVGDGLAMLGMDVRYGNRLFIHQDENGYIVDFDLNKDMDNKEELTDRIAEAIIKIFEDQERLEKFHEASFEIAKEYEENVVESKWLKLIAGQQ